MQRHLVVGAVTALLVVGCGERDDPPEEPPSYFSELAAVTAALDEANSSADADLHAALETTRERDVGDLFARVTAEAATRHEAAIAEMAALDPPSSVTDAHAVLLETSGELVAQDRSAAQEMAGMDAEALGAREVPAAYREAEAAADAACADLQRLADRAGADVDLCVGLYAP
jgi:NADH dehydrogenase/NADH:ubiquinone oxidoreductase subunit G